MVSGLPGKPGPKLPIAKILVSMARPRFMRQLSSATAWAN
jgi:hypothetical protein